MLISTILSRITRCVFSQRKFHRSAISFNEILQKNRTYSEHEGYALTSPFEEISIPDKTLDQFIWDSVRQWGDRTAFLCSESGKSYTFAQLRDHSAALAVRLQTNFGLKRGDTVAVLLPNTAEYCIALLGAIEAGFQVTIMNPMYTPAEMARQMHLSSTKLVICSSTCEASVEKALELGNIAAKTVVIKANKDDKLPTGVLDFYELIEKNNMSFIALSTRHRSPNDACVLPFSSGSSGLSKGVMLTHRNLIANLLQMSVKLPDNRIFPMATTDHQGIACAVLPFFHIGGLQSLLLATSSGSKLIIFPNFKPETFLHNLVKHRIDTMLTAPVFIALLANNKNVTKSNLEHIRCVAATAAPVGEQDVIKLLDKQPMINFYNCYGLTESTGAAVMSPNNFSKYAAVGHPLSNTEFKVVKVDDQKHFGLDVEEVGELWLRSPTVMKGYDQNEKVTNEILTKDGWLRTGDLGYYDQDGLIYVKDRIKELIKVKGYQVPPGELESLLRSHPKVAEAGVVGVADSKYGEVPRAYIVLNTGAIANEQELIDFIAEKVIEYKQLKGGVQFVSTLPKNAAGKVLRRMLGN